MEYSEVAAGADSRGDSLAAVGCMFAVACPCHVGPGRVDIAVAVRAMVVGGGQRVQLLIHQRREAGSRAEDLGSLCLGTWGLVLRMLSVMAINCGGQSRIRA
jgi:hypothetical protein